MGGETVVADTPEKILQLLERTEPTIILIPEGVYDFRDPHTAQAIADADGPRVQPVASCLVSVTTSGQAPSTSRRTVAES